MIKDSFIRRSTLLLLGLILCTGPAGSSFAQAYQGQIAFLEQFATRLYERGDYAGAMKEFERIARIDPRNASAIEHLKLIADKTGIKPAAAINPLAQIDTIIGDINVLKENISLYDTDNRDLEYLIRNLINENDALYAALQTRSRELATDLAKNTGVSYNQAYDSLMKNFSPERIAQHPHQSNDLLALTREQSPQVSVNVPPAANGRSTNVTAPDTIVTADEVETLIQNVIAQKKSLAPNPQTQAMAATLENKRDVLIDKAVTQLDKHENLNTIKSTLLEVNKSLKEIDAYYRDIKTSLAQKNFTEQKQFADLMIDYANKLQEIDTLKAQAAVAAKAPASVSTVPAAPVQVSLAAATSATAPAAASSPAATIPAIPAVTAPPLVVSPRIPAPEPGAEPKSVDAYNKTIKSELAQKNFNDQKKYADLLVEHTAMLKEITDLKGRIDHAQEGLLPAQDKLAVQNASLSSLDDILKAKDKEIADYKALLAQKNIIIERQQADLRFTDKELDKAGDRLTSIEDLLKQNDTDLADLQAGVSKVRALVAAKAAVIPPPAAPPVAKAPAIDETPALKQQLALKDSLLTTLKSDCAKTSEQFSQAKAKIAELQSAVTALKDENATLKTTTAERAVFFNTLNSRLAELSSRADTKNTELLEQQKTLSTLTTQMEKLETQANTARAELSDRGQELRRAQSQVRALEAELTKTEAIAERNKNATLQLQDDNSARALTITQLKTEVAALTAETEKLRGKTILMSAGQPVSAVSTSAGTPVNMEEARILHETLSRKDDEIIALKKQVIALNTSVNNNVQVKAGAAKTTAQEHDLDLQEKTNLIYKLQSDLDQKTRVIIQADTETAKLQEKLSILEAKQDAIKGVVQKRDMEYLRLNAETEAKTKDLTLMTKERDELKAAINNKLSAATLAESTLTKREEEIARLNTEIKSLQETVTNAHEEIARLNNELKKLRK
ncbi:MAG: hypothetical protein HQL22_04790 [Candidatus Omnitrophica bacterium]|nr:hypothetical protein [Candidatus Omnitrophota bacterium]